MSFYLQRKTLIMRSNLIISCLELTFFSLLKTFHTLKIYLNSIQDVGLGQKKKKFGDISFKVFDEPIISQNSLKFLLAEKTK